MSGLLPALGGGAGNVIQLAAGGLSGVLTMSALIATGVVGVPPAPAPSAGASAALALLGCPDAGSVVAIAQPGDRMLVTGRSADGAWLRVYVPGPGGNDGWAPAASVTLLADGAALPIVACPTAPDQESPSTSPSPVPATVNPSESPSPAPSAPPTASPPPKPIVAPTPTPAPTAAPPTTPAPTRPPSPTRSPPPIPPKSPPPSPTPPPRPTPTPR